MIDPALNAAILAAINSLQAAGNINSPMSREALIGSIMGINATCRAFTHGAVEAELRHIIRDQPMLTGPRTRRGYLQADLHALS